MIITKIHYAGIGSRATPEPVLEQMKQIAKEFARRGYVLRSGGADGADSAFEKGAVYGRGEREIFLPWKLFNGNSSSLILESEEAYILASQFHPGWNRLTSGARKLMARNMHQVLGWDLQSKTDFIVCWTEGGKLAGGTAQALRVAIKYEIEVYNLGNPKTSIDAVLTETAEKYGMKE